MKKLLTAGALTLSIALGSCGTTGTTTATTTINQIIAEAQAVAVQVCGFLPTAATIVGIVSAGNPLVSTGSAIAQSICAALATAPKLGARRLGAALPSVGGVVIHGRYVK